MDWTGYFAHIQCDKGVLHINTDPPEWATLEGRCCITRQTLHHYGPATNVIVPESFVPLKS